jgi:hypothetical protein
MKTLRYNNGGPMSNKEFRRNERFRSRAERDARIATRRADDTGDLLDNLDNYYEKKDRDIAAKALGTMGTIGSLAKLAYMLEQRRRRAIADRQRIQGNYPYNVYTTDEPDPSQPG